MTKTGAKIPPAQLWIGSGEKLLSSVYSYLQTIWCVHGACKLCLTCRQIVSGSYFALRWLQPEKQLYTIEQIKNLTSSLSFMLDEGQLFFIVLENAELLSTSAANALLKTLEEPLPGYCFLLLACQKDAVLPTIASRCVLHHQEYSPDEENFKELVALFTDKRVAAYKELQKELDKAIPTELETRKLLDRMVAYWLEQLQKSSIESHKIGAILDLYKKYLGCLPMPGSGKIFWKNLYLQHILLIS